ncbi:MAG: exopolysaccharide biosynthesis protein [Nitrospirales bacterium]|nr:MAG: exopolysaccharide biosynthesis protein [Nitrospirales bacterium]
MSKIYDALQIAHSARTGSAPKNDEEPAASILPTFSGPGCLLPKIYYDSEFSVLAQNILSLLAIPEKNVIQFIGSREGEGTSTLTREFAMAMARQSTKPVLLVEADNYKPCQYQAFGIEAKPSLDHLLQEGLSLDRVVTEVEKSNLFLATLSSELQSSLSGRNFFGSIDLWKPVREQFSLILLDSTPANFSAESLAISGTVDGVVLVVEAEKTRSVIARSVKEQILMYNGNLLGIVFTKRKFHIPKFLYKFL